MKTYAFIDASNLFYGGEKSLGWKIDYLKLIKYLKKKYRISEVYYFGGVETHGYKYDYLKNDTVPLKELERRLVDYVDKEGKKLDEAKLLLLSRHLSRIRFYLKLQQFGYKLFLKPVKLYYQEDGSTQRKANCDVEMAFYLMKEKDNFDRALFLSGDGDFLPLLKYLKGIGKEVIVLARGPRTAREIRQFAGNNFRDFVRLENEIRFEEKG
ncbi:MAG: NYN domain-containing protein [bacterium]|nr:NYN domain-containing protein [bacterium]